MVLREIQPLSKDEVWVLNEVADIAASSCRSVLHAPLYMACLRLQHMPHPLPELTAALSNCLCQCVLVPCCLFSFQPVLGPVVWGESQVVIRQVNLYVI